MSAPTLDLLPAPSTATWTAAAAVLIVLAGVTVLCVLRARRLDRLHRRTDAARVGLADALERRGTLALRAADAVEAPPRRPGPDPTSGTLVRTYPTNVPFVANARPGAPALRAVSDGPALRAVPDGPALRAVPDGPALRAVSDGPALRAAAHDALRACRSGLRASGGGLEPCEGAENILTRRLAAVDRAALPAGLASELVDAEQLAVLSRRVYNDAVRDTLDLRSRRLVRWLRLAGTAPVPAYFEIADPPRGPVLPTVLPPVTPPVAASVTATIPVTPPAGVTGAVAG